MKITNKCKQKRIINHKKAQKKKALIKNSNISTIQIFSKVVNKNKKKNIIRYRICKILRISNKKKIASISKTLIYSMNNRIISSINKALINPPRKNLAKMIKQFNKNKFMMRKFKNKRKSNSKMTKFKKLRAVKSIYENLQNIGSHSKALVVKRITGMIIKKSNHQRKKMIIQITPNMLRN